MRSQGQSIGAEAQQARELKASDNGTLSDGRASLVSRGLSLARPVT